MFITNNEKDQSKGSIETGSQVKSKKEIIAFEYRIKRYENCFKEIKKGNNY